MEERGTESRQERPPALTLGRSIAGIGALLVIVMFFQPWVQWLVSSSAGRILTTYTGLSLPGRFPYLSLLVGVVAITVLATTLNRWPADVGGRARASLVLGLIGMAIVGIGLAGNSSQLVFHGFWGSFIGHLGIILGSLIDLTQASRGGNSS